MSGRLRWGILGTGWIAHQQVTDLLGDGGTVTAVGSRTHESAARFAVQYGIPVAHGSYEALVEDPEVDVVYVATPHPFHAANATLALNAGKHVLVEKPFTVTAAEARAVVDLAAERGLVVLEAMWTRFLPHMARIREIIAAGGIGEVRSLIADHNQDLPKDALHRINNPELGGGTLLDLGIYPVSFSFDLFGAPSVVKAISSPTATGVDRQTAILFGYPDGQQAVLHTALDAPGSNRAAIIGTAGRIEVDSVWYTPTGFSVYDASGEVTERYASEVADRGMQFQARELERLVAEGPSGGDLLPPAQSVSVIETLDEIRRQIGLVYPTE
jgi:predicted dehydrogenase